MSGEIEFERMSGKAPCEYSGRHSFIFESDTDSVKENDGALCIAGNYSHEIDCAMGENIPINDIQHQFIMAAEKYIKDMDFVSRKEKLLLMDIKESLPREASRVLNKVKTSMQLMHTKYAKQLDTKLNELTAVLTRVEHLYEEMQDFKQWERTDGEGISRIDSFLQDSLRRKEMIESLIEQTVSALNQKRQNDERLFSEFSESIKQQVRQSTEILQRCLQKADMRRKDRLDAKLTELKHVLQDLKKFG